jgi:hypothetical protein
MLQLGCPGGLNIAANCNKAKAACASKVAVKGSATLCFIHTWLQQPGVRGARISRIALNGSHHRANIRHLAKASE